MNNVVRLDLLVEAIVRQAANDYRYAKKLITQDPYDYKAIGLKINCETFFKSNWFSKLTGLNGYDILKKLDEEKEYIRVSDEISSYI